MERPTERGVVAGTRVGVVIVIPVFLATLVAVFLVVLVLVFGRYLGCSSVPGQGLDSCVAVWFLFLCWRFRCCFGLCFRVVGGLAPGLVLAWSFQFLLFSAFDETYILPDYLDIPTCYFVSTRLCFCNFEQGAKPLCEGSRLLGSVTAGWHQGATFLALPPL